MTKWEKTRLLNLRAKRDVGFKLTKSEARILSRLESIEKKLQVEGMLVESKRLMAQAARLIKQAKKIHFASEKRRISGQE